MKRGVIINLIVLLVLALLLALPWIALFAVERVAQASGCELTPSPGQSGDCSSLTGLALLIGYGLIAYIPIVAGISGLYLLGVGTFFLVSLVTGKQAGRPVSPVALGMLYSSLAVLAAAGLAAAAFGAVNWYRVSYVSACQRLPERPAAGGLPNGPLALGVRLPYPEGRPQQFVIWSLNPNGGAPETLAKLPGSKDPAWSPDGSEIAFAGQALAGWGLYRTSTGGGEPQLILESEPEMRRPDWSPDSARLLFDRPQVPGSNPQINLYSLPLSGGEPAPLVATPKDEETARYSPDGKQIVFASKMDGRGDIYSVNADGTGLRRLTFNPAWESDPAWSPDGRWIVFASSRDTIPGRTNYALYIMSPDGKNQCRLTDLPGSQARPAWSPDGQWIAFISLLDNKLYRIRPDGTDLTAIPIEAEVTGLLTLDWGRAR